MTAQFSVSFFLVHGLRLIFAGVVVANKKDKSDVAQVTSFQGSEFARAQNFEFFETSAVCVVVQASYHSL